MTFVAIAIGGVGLAGLASSAISANAAGNAAQTQANTAQNVAELQYQTGEQTLSLEEQEYLQNLQNEMPWLQTGQEANANLSYLMGLQPQGNMAQMPGTGGSGGTSGSGIQLPAIPGGSGSGGGSGSQFYKDANGQGYQMVNGVLQPVNSWQQWLSAGGPNNFNVPTLTPQQVTQMSTAPTSVAAAATPLSSTVNPALGAPGSLLQPWGQTFTAPTAAQAEQTPGYEFALDQGEKAIQGSAAANGNLLTGGTMNALDQYAQGLADTNYGNVYNQALQAYNTNYNTFANNQANTFNRLQALSSGGQTTAGNLGSSGAASTDLMANTATGTATSVGQQLTNAGAATASGYVGAANAYGNGLSSLGSLGMLYAMMNSKNGGETSTTNNLAV